MSALNSTAEASMSSNIPSASAPAWRAFVHAYFPILTSIFFILSVTNPFQYRAMLLASAIPTYYLGSLVYHPRPRSPVRFTRQSHLYRAIVLFTYGRAMGSQFNPRFYLMDLFASYVTGALFDKAVGAPPRTSEFLVYALWTTGSGLLMRAVPPGWNLIWTSAVWIDRAMWRATYLAVVDDIVRALAYPDVGSTWGKATVLALQAVLIAVLVLLVHFIYVVGGREQVQEEVEENLRRDGRIG